MYQNDYVVQGIYKQAASDIIDKIKALFGVDEPEAIDAASALATGAAGAGGAIGGAKLGRGIGEARAFDALADKVGTLKDSMRTNAAIDKEVAREFMRQQTRFDNLASRANPSRGWNPSLDSLNKLKDFANRRIKLGHNGKGGAESHIARQQTKRMNRAMARGGKIGGIAGGVGGGILAAGAAYALSNPRTRAAIANMVG